MPLSFLQVGHAWRRIRRFLPEPPQLAIFTLEKNQLRGTLSPSEFLKGWKVISAVVSVITVILYLFTTFKEVLEKLLNAENERDKD